MGWSFMLNFSPISISDKPRLAPHLACNRVRINERSFASMFMWGRHYGFETCVKDEVLYTHCLPVDGYRIFLAPIGCGDTTAAFERIHRDCLRLGQPYRVYCVSREEADELDEIAQNIPTFVEEKYAEFLTGSNDINDDAVW